MQLLFYINIIKITYLDCQFFLTLVRFLNLLIYIVMYCFPSSPFYFQFFFFALKSFESLLFSNISIEPLGKLVVKLLLSLFLSEVELLFLIFILLYSSEGRFSSISFFFIFFFLTNFFSNEELLLGLV